MAFGSVCLGFAHPDVWIGAPTFYGCLNDTFREDFKGKRRIMGRYVEVQSGPMIDQARNDIVEAFLAHPDNPAWLLMIDADMVWSPMDVTQLLETADEKERPVIGGLCFAESRRDGGRLWPTMGILVPGPDGDVHAVRWLADWPRGEVCKIDVTGAAFLLVHRSVYVRMRERMGPRHPAPWFAITYLAEDRLGEDVTFSLRCQALGIPVHIHAGVSVGHTKLRVLTEAVYDEQQAREERPRLEVVR